MLKAKKKTKEELLKEKAKLDAEIKEITNEELRELEEIKANDYSLNPGRYVEIKEKEMDNVDFEERMKELTTEFKELTEEAHELEDKIMDDWDKII